MQRLNSGQRWAVRFVEEIFAHFKHVVWPQTDEGAVKRSVMQGAQGKTIPNYWLTVRMSIWRDVRSVQHFLVPKAAEGALALVRIKHTLSECALVQTNLYCGGSVSTTEVVGARVRRDRRGRLGKSDVLGVIYRDRESQLRRVIADNKDRPGGEVLARYEPVEIDERLSFRYQSAQADVVSMGRVGAAVPISKKSVRPHGVVVGSTRSSCDG